MNFDRLNLAGCIIAQAVPPTSGDGGDLPDQRCADAAFASANPTVCGAAAYLIIKPAVALLCKLGSINFSVFLYQNGIETQVTDGLTFSSSDPDILAIGVHTGSATGLAAGEVNVTVSRAGLTAKSILTVLTQECGQGDCNDIHVKTSILIDDSKSSGLAFGGGYSSRLAFGKAAALDYISKILQITELSDCVNVIPDGTVYNGAGTLNIHSFLTGGTAYQISFGGNDNHLSFTNPDGDPSNIYAPGTMIFTTHNPLLVAELHGIPDAPVTAIICAVPSIISQIPKDAVKIWSFTDIVNLLSPDFLNDVDELAAEINGIIQTQQKTDIGAILLAAVNDMLAATADEKIIIIISDGEHTSNANTQAILDTATLFKAAGGIIIAVGLRATGAGYDLLSRIATGGFFINALPNGAADVLDQLNYLKFILCVGDCITSRDSINTAALDFSSFINWEVIAGQVNLLGNGFIDLQPGNGLYVDMMGGSAGTIRTIDSFSLTGGQSYRISFKAAGNNRLNSLAGQKLQVSVMNADDSVPLPLSLIFNHVVIPNWDDPFTTYSFSFTAPFDVDVKLLFQQLFDSTFSGEWHGNLLDDVKFEEVSTLTTLFSDNFNAENPVVIPANDYGDYCSIGVPGTQNTDPNPLPDVESGLGATITYTSTKTACASCPAGSVNFPTQSIVPVMTSNTLPGGVISDNAGSVDAWLAFDNDPATNWTASVLASWLRYQLVNTKKVIAYSITATSDAPTAPANWILQGSNDATTWIDLDTQAGIVWFGGETKRFAFTNVTGYLYYRFSISATQNGDPAQISEIQLFESAPTQICKSAAATSFISQADADSKATLAAQADAQSNLNCVQRFSSTQQFTASCPVGQSGVSVTKSATATSLNSQNEADASALALATTAANAELTCGVSTNGQPITMAAEADYAIPYPSVKFVSGLSGLVTKVTLSLSQYHIGGTSSAHNYLLLVSPTGQKCIIFSNLTSAVLTGGTVDLIFDDAAGSFLPNVGFVTSGTYKPTQNGVNDLGVPAPAQPYATTLATFIGHNPNGSWALYFYDPTGVNLESIQQWDLTISV